MPRCGVHCVWFAFVCLLIRSHPLAPRYRSSLRRVEGRPPRQGGPHVSGGDGPTHPSGPPNPHRWFPTFGICTSRGLPSPVTVHHTWGEMGADGGKWGQTGANGGKWGEMGGNGGRWGEMGGNGGRWGEIGGNGGRWGEMGANGGKLGGNGGRWGGNGGK